MICENCKKEVEKLVILMVVDKFGYVGSGLGVKKCCLECSNINKDGTINQVWGKNK